MRVGFVCQWYPPEVGATVPRAIAHGLAELGDDVHVLTGFPNYPTGELYPGYRVRPYAQEADGPVTVHRAPLYPDHSRSALRRMGNYLSFAAGASAVSVTTFPAPDVWLTYSSPATAAIPAMLLRNRRRPHALIVQDLWPDSVTGSDMARGPARRFMSRPLEVFSSSTYRSADAIGVISPGMSDLLVARGVEPEKIHYTPNWIANPPDRPAAPSAGDRSGLGLPAEGTLFLYAGNFGEMQELVPLIETFDGVEDAQLVLIGSGASKADVVAAAEGRPNVHVLPPVDSDVVRGYHLAADVLVVSLRDTPLLRVTMPSKLQSAMAAGRPIFVHGAGDVADVVRRAECGAAGTPHTDEPLHALRNLVDAGPAGRARMGANARQWYDANFSASAGARRVRDLLISAVERNSAC